MLAHNAWCVLAHGERMRAQQDRARAHHIAHNQTLSEYTVRGTNLNPDRALCSCYAHAHAHAHALAQVISDSGYSRLAVEWAADVFTGTACFAHFERDVCHRPTA